ncbi:iron complex transport system ATP-binding protein [Methanofollis sp. W23]|uniref:ABC transporter ATP-binding protein n=1 Tax=Methanofollis sp. W23 TaxID=2817849 RepID=UPI001E14B66D|nr:ATP-binding cassette domain-containing protein [Methanofollis sp. W23]MBP2145136.1 iron complex transport system ATP-binding protein [Methanofollis sp. W23]
MDPPLLLDFAHLTVMKGKTTLLDSVSLAVGAGEHLAILGPNGAGKSSLVRTITREHYPVAEEGRRFRILGKEVWDVTGLRAMLGIVSHDLQCTFSREITGREVVLSGFFSSIGLYGHEVSAAMEAKADEVLRFLEVEHLRDRPMTQVSTGEGRRLLIGRALVHDPIALILDEPTASLDLHALHHFRSMLRKIACSGTGVVLVTHHLHDIIPEIRRVVLMKNGRIYRDGPKEEVLTDTVIGDLFEVPVEIREEGGWYYATRY